MKHYSDEVVRACISNLLCMLDDALGTEMHWYGQTPDWYVCASMVACDIEDNEGEATAMILALAEQNKPKPQHRWEYCAFCEHEVVICGTCGNNSCNGGYGTVGDKDCPDCPSAYELYAKGK